MSGESRTGQRAPGSGDVLSRRNIVKSAVGVAVGGALLAEVAAPSASAAEQATTVESGALAPAVVHLTDAAAIAVDASLGNDFRVTIGGNRTMGNPANPANGQQIIFQVTQGSSGSFTLTWGSAYEFSGNLPQPTLSTAAGETDLLGFIYNQSTGTWLFAAFVNGFTGSTSSPSPTPTPTTTSPTPTPTPTTTTSGPPPTGYRLFPSINGPSSPVSYSGDFLAGVLFCVTSNCWFEGYWWWVCPTGQPTAPQKFALWQIYGGGQGNVIPGSVVKSGTLTAGQWNYVPLPTPLPLSVGNVTGIGAAVYEVATGFVGSFPDTNSQFGSGEPYASGITNGPLFGYSDQGASAPSPTASTSFQGAFGTAGTDPSVNLPSQGSSSSNFWIDLQVSSAAPSGYSGSYRLWPNYPTVFPNQSTIDTQAQTMGTQFTLSQACTLNNVWFYSPSFAADLPASTQIWNATTQTLVSGTNLTASWSGALGSGWVANSYASAGIVLPAGNYIATIYYGGGKVFYLESRGYFGAYQGHAGPGTNGLINGPLSSPAQANAFNPPGGNSCYFVGGTAPTYPNTWDSNDGGENRWIDVEVTPS